jgi:hypothetical protein
MKKRFCGLAIGLATVTLLFQSCGMLSGVQRSPGGNWIFDWEANTREGLAEYEVAFKDNPDSVPEKIETGLFHRISWFNTILGTFELHQKLNMEQKRQLFDALFGYIPGRPQDQAYRVVSLGKFKKEKPLIFLLAAAELNEKAPPGSILGIDILSNCMYWDVKEKNSSVFTRDFTITELRQAEINWNSFGLLFSDGLLVKGNDLFNEKKIEKWKKESGNDQGMLAVNLSDLYIKDELVSNNAEAAAMLERVIADTSAEPLIAVSARLNYFLYLLSTGDTGGAEKTLREAADIAGTINDKDPGMVSALEYEAPAMLELYKHFL